MDRAEDERPTAAFDLRELRIQFEGAVDVERMVDVRGRDGRIVEPRGGPQARLAHHPLIHPPLNGIAARHRFEIASCHEADCAHAVVGAEAAAYNRGYDVGAGSVPFRNTL